MLVDWLVPNITTDNLKITVVEKGDNVRGWMKTSQNHGLINEWG